MIAYDAAVVVRGCRVAWTYHDYEEQTSDTARLTRLRLHIGEVSAAMTADVTADGKSRSAGNLRAYLADLQTRRRELERSSGTGASAPAAALVDFRGGD